MGHSSLEYLGYLLPGWHTTEAPSDSELGGMLCDSEEDWEYIDVSNRRGFEVRMAVLGAKFFLICTVGDWSHFKWSSCIWIAGTLPLFREDCK